MIGLAIAVPGAGLVALDHFYWSIKAGALAEDDFWDRCKSLAMQGKLEPGRYESVVWSERNEQGICEDVLGYFAVNKDDNGTMNCHALEDHQIRTIASASANCTYLGQLLTERSQFKKVTDAPPT
ncbi:MAG: hypothetical protein INF92_02465 [Rhodobacter sp.]|nr:hypothetical protein [Rhodobacter sp.]